jgi:hypothetical protein
MQRLRRALGKAADAKDAATARLADAKDAAAARLADAAAARLAGGRAPAHAPEPSEPSEQTGHTAGPPIGPPIGPPPAPTYVDNSPEAERVRRAWRHFQRHAKCMDGADQQLGARLVTKVRRWF